jgi:cbb3-type cytochrome oxidase subunit 3
MSLTDIVSSLDQPWLAEAGLVCFLAAFAVILARMFRRGHREADRAAAALPLNDGPALAHPANHARGDSHASAS